MAVSTRTWQKAVESLQASNLSGLAHFLVRATAELRAEKDSSTASVNTHPVVRLVVAQMAHLAFGGYDCHEKESFRQAYELAQIEAMK